MQADRLSVAIALCATAKGISPASFEHLALTRVFLPSLLRTTENIYTYGIFVGVDDDDEFYTNSSNQEQLLKLSSPHPIHVYSFPSKDSRIPFNEILEVAYRSGSDYIVRINDDTEFISHNWTSKGIDTLLSHFPANLGVVGPRVVERPGIKNTILTHDMVHRTHREIFPYYYSPFFDNQLIDDWITLVYTPGCVSWVADWIVDHHTSLHGTRYTIKHDFELLDKEVRKGVQAVEEWRNQSVASARNWVVVVRIAETSEDTFAKWWQRYSNLELSLTVIVLATDWTSFNKFRSRREFTTYFRPCEPNNSAATVASRYPAHDSERLKSTRAGDILFLLSKYEKILYSDLKAVWLKDPTPFLSQRFDIAGAFDAWIDDRPLYSTDLLAIRNSSAALKLISDWDAAMKSSPQLEAPIFNQLLKNRGHDILDVPLPRAHFPSGVLSHSHQHADRAIILLASTARSI